MQPTTYETVSEMTLAGIRTAARPGLQGGLRARVVYGFLILALCLMIADFCRMTQAPSARPFAA
jgi:hypothetical protein